MKMFGVFGLLFAFSFYSSTGFSQRGTESGGGGDPISIEFLQIARTLPGIISALGVENFPGVSIERLQSAVIDPQWKIELGNDVKFNGAPKAAVTYPEHKFTIIGQDLWLYMSFSPAAESRKRALVFHELLVLVGLEVNNDYHLSSLLHGSDSLQDPAYGRKGLVTVGKILSNDGSPAGIFSFIYADQTVRYVFCENKYESCRTLGDPQRFYTFDEIKRLNTQANKRLKISQRVGIATWVVFGTVLVAAGVYGGPLTWGRALLLAAGIFSGAMPTVMIDKFYGTSQRAITIMTGENQMAGGSNYGSQISQLALLLEKKLLSLELNPSVPPVLVRSLP